MHRDPSSRPTDAPASKKKAPLLSELATGAADSAPPPAQDRPAPLPGRDTADPADQPPLTSQSAFDALYVSTAPGLVQQAYVLTGCRRLAFESCEQAFHRAWERWPEVARDPDPVGWVRARSHEYALSPWHRLRRVVTRPQRPPADPVLRAFLELPPWQRRAALLCDGLDLSVEEAAVETEATVAATSSRLRHARAGIGPHLPDTTADGARRALRTRVEDASVATLAQPWSVRAAGELRVRRLTRGVYAATAALLGLVTLAAATGSPANEPADSRRPPGPRHTTLTSTG